MTRKLLIATVAALAGFSGGLAGWLTAYASAPVADCQPYIDRGYSLVCSLNLSHGTIAAAPVATVDQYCRDGNLPFPPGVTAGAVRAGVYRLAVQRDANTVRETIKAGLDAFAASKGNGPYKVIADDLKARVDLFDAARLYPGDAQ